jgi:hypothetical protein
MQDHLNRENKKMIQNAALKIEELVSKNEMEPENANVENDGVVTAEDVILVDEN